MSSTVKRRNHTYISSNPLTQVFSNFSSTVLRHFHRGRHRRCLGDPHFLSSGCASALVTTYSLLSLNVLLCSPVYRARVCSRCRQYFSFWGRRVHRMVTTLCTFFICHRSRPACNWNVASLPLVFSGPSDLSSAKKGASCVVTYSPPQQETKGL
jgi:hypothetical protein